MIGFDLPLHIIVFLLKFIFVWVISWVGLHEFFHAYPDGTINIFRFGATATSNHTFLSKYFYLKAGVLSGICLLSMCFLTSDIDFKIIFSSLGILQLGYGLFEYLYILKLDAKQYKFKRYSFYVGILILMGLFWWWYLRGRLWIL